MRPFLTLALALNLSLHAAEEKVKTGNGSGFFITTDGYFVTNQHVVDGADSVAVKFDDKIIPARVTKTDANNDIAILKLEGTYPCLPLGEDLQTRPGEDVFTIGFPMTDVMGEAPKTTLGTVSAISGVEDDPRIRPWREVQKEVEKCAGLVLIYKNIIKQQETKPAEKINPGTQPALVQSVWVFPDSSSRVLSRAELSQLDATVLWRARNEIYARNGLIFSSARGKAFAASLGNAYRGTDSDQVRVHKNMNRTEQANVELIKSFEP